MKSNEEKSGGGEMSCSSEDVSTTMICQKHLLTYTSHSFSFNSAFDSLPLIGLFSQYISLIYTVLFLRTSGASYILALTTNSQHKQSGTVSVTFLLIMAREKAFSRENFVSWTFNNFTSSVLDDWLCCKDLIWTLENCTAWKIIFSRLNFYRFNLLKSNILAVAMLY